MILRWRPASFISLLSSVLALMGIKKGPNIGNDQRHCNLINNFGLQGKEVWKDKSFPAISKTKLVHKFRLTNSRKKGHTYCWTLTEGGTCLLFLSLSSFCLSRDCHHYQSSQVSHCQLTRFFSEVLPVKSGGFPIPVRTELVKCLLFW